MKRIFLILITFILTFTAQAQDVVSWDFSFNPKTNQIEMTAKIQDGWHLYSQFIENTVGPVPTTFTFKSSNDFQLIGAVAEPKPIQKYDETFEATLDFFESKVVFVQQVNAKRETVLEGTVTFMVCNQTMCLPPVDKQFKISIPKN